MASRPWLICLSVFSRPSPSGGGPAQGILDLQSSPGALIVPAVQVLQLCAVRCIPSRLWLGRKHGEMLAEEHDNPQRERPLAHVLPCRW